MSNGERRVTILLVLPVFYNPDVHGERKPIEDGKFRTTMEEIAAEFGGGMLFRFAEGGPRGYWWDKGFVDEDVLAILEVDVPDDEENIAWFKRYTKEVLLRRFEQKAIYLKILGPVETLVVKDEVVTD